MPIRSVITRRRVASSSRSPRIRLIDNHQRREILPNQASLIFRTRADERCQQRPSPGLWYADFKPLNHREETLKLAEDQLLSCFRGDRLGQKSSCLARVKMSQKSIHASFAPASEFLTEVDKLLNIRVRVDIVALLWGTGSENVAEHSGVAYLLLRHECDQLAV